MNKYVQLKGLDTDLNLVMGAMYLQNVFNRKAHEYLHTVLAEDW